MSKKYIVADKFINELIDVLIDDCHNAFMSDTVSSKVSWWRIGELDKYYTQLNNLRIEVGKKSISVEDENFYKYTHIDADDSRLTDLYRKINELNKRRMLKKIDEEINYIKGQGWE